MSRFCLLLIACCISWSPIFSQTVIWDESIDGDLPASAGIGNTIWQELNLEDGVNIIKGTIGNAFFNGTDPQSDAFSFSVPPGGVITAFDVTSFTLQNANTGTFIGGWTGAPLVLIPPTGPVTAPTSLLTVCFGGGPLFAGDYGISMNESTVEGSVYEFSITCFGCSPGIPTLSQWSLILLALSLLTVSSVVLRNQTTIHYQQ